MKPNARYKYPLAMALAVTAPSACGDDSDGDPEVAADGSTSQAGDDGGTIGAAGSTSCDPPTGTGAVDDGTGGEDPFADCDRATLAADFGVVDTMGVPGPPRWYGPGADPKTGELIDDGVTTYVVSVTYLALQADAFPAFLELNPPLSEALYGNPGMIATQLGASSQCNAARTFTVWADEAALMEFVASDAHVAAIGAFPSLSRGSSTLSVWDELVPPSDITWDEALTRIQVEAPYD